MRSFCWGALVWLLAACSGSSADSKLQVACVDKDPMCGKACSDSNPCGSGLYCAGGAMCAKQCIYGEPNACPNGAPCAGNGKCLDTQAGAGSGGAGAGGKAGHDAVAGSGGQAATGGGAGSDGCVQTVVHTQRVQPTVILIVDQSGSMTEEFDTGTRWDVLRNSLLSQPNGLVAQLQSQVSFGLALYSADSDGDADGTMVAPGGECPSVQKVSPSLNNYDSIKTLYQSQPPLEDTPTGDSIDAVVSWLDVDAHPSTEFNPIIFVLATDGEPDRCENLDPATDPGRAAARMESVAAVTHAFEKNIRTYVIAVGNDVSVQHQQEVANAGIGRITSDPPAPYWRPDDDQALRDALTQIVGGEISCDIALDGSVQGSNPCLGTVDLDGNRLECNDPDGWELSDSTHIRLLGDACAQLKSDVEATLNVSFPCAVTVVFPD